MNRPESTAAIPKPARNLRLWVLYAALVAVMQFSDPLADVGLADTLVFWISRLVALLASLVFAEWLVSHVFVERWQTPVWLKPAILMPVIAAVPLTMVEILVESVVPQAAAYDDSDLQAVSPLLAALGEYLTILSIVLPVNVLLWVVIDRRRDTASPAGAALEPVAQPAFLAKTAFGLADVVALAAEEHYVRVWTADGSELVYGKLSDAIAEMPDALGLQVHRSWWVADAGVMHAKRGERRYQLELVNGEKVPVSDRFAKRVRERGLLQRRNKVSAH